MATYGKAIRGLGRSSLKSRIRAMASRSKWTSASSTDTRPRHQQRFEAGECRASRSTPYSTATAGSKASTSLSGARTIGAWFLTAASCSRVTITSSRLSALESGRCEPARPAKVRWQSRTRNPPENHGRALRAQRFKVDGASFNPAKAEIVAGDGVAFEVTGRDVSIRIELENRKQDSRPGRRKVGLRIPGRLADTQSVPSRKKSAK